MTDRLTYLDALQRLKDAAVALGTSPSVANKHRLHAAALDYVEASIRTGLGDPVRLAPDAGAVLDARD